jgi:chromate transporter
MMIAWIQDQAVQQWHWLTPQEFLDGLALGQVTPGPALVVTAYIGYKVAGIVGAGIAATASYVPSFILILAMLPMFERVRTLDTLGGFCQRLPRPVYQSHAFRFRRDRPR